MRRVQQQGLKSCESSRFVYITEFVPYESFLSSNPSLGRKSYTDWRLGYSNCRDCLGVWCNGGDE